MKASAASRLPAGKIVVTGAAGFIGRHLTQLLASEGRASDVVAVSLNGPRDVDLRDRGAAAALVRETKPAVIFHLAGLIYSSDLAELYASNVGATEHLLEAVMAHAPECRVVVPGSAAEYGRVDAAHLPIGEDKLPAPLSSYGLSKVWQTFATGYFAARGAHAVVARIFNLLGPSAPATLSIGAFAQQIRSIAAGGKEPKLFVGDLTPRRDFVDVRDACEGLMALAARPDLRGIYNVCSGSSLPVSGILEMLIAESGLEVKVSLDSARLRHKAEIPDSFGSPRRIAEATGWSPRIPLRQSLKEMLLSSRDG